MKRLINKSILISLLCTLFQYYAFSVYAFSAVILSPLFFQSETIHLTKVLGVVTLSIPLLLKPLGSIVFGHVGDKYGRKKALIYSLVLITIATTCIGLIPSYSYIGWTSSLLLMICLFIQGLCMGGQYTGAIIYIQEHTEKKYAAFSCGLVGAIGVFGTLLGTATSFLFYYIDTLGWEWRIPFLLTSLMGIGLLYFMRHMQETPVFIENKDEAKLKRIPLIEIMKTHKKVLCSAIFLSSISVSMFYLATVYMPNFYGEEDNLNNVFDTLSLTCLAQIFCILLIPLLGYTADKFGKERQLKLASISLIVTPFFMFSAMTLFNNVYMLVCGIILLSSFVSLYTGSAPAYLSEKFPVIGKYSGMGLGISLGEGIFGGLSPLICIGIEQTFDSKIAPAFYIIFLGLMSALGLLLLRKKTSLKLGLSSKMNGICQNS